MKKILVVAAAFALVGGGLALAHNSTYECTFQNGPVRHWHGTNNNNTFSVTAYSTDHWCIDGLDGADDLTGGEVADHLFGRKGGDTIQGGPGNDTVVGGPGNDDLRGGSGNDDLYDGNGDDIVSGGAGFDIMMNCPGDSDSVDSSVEEIQTSSNYCNGLQ